jgi:hypothetical protein
LIHSNKKEKKKKEKERKGKERKGKKERKKNFSFRSLNSDNRFRE